MYRYASFKTKQMAFDFVQHQLATGNFSVCELGGIEYSNGRYHVMVRNALVVSVRTIAC